MKWTILFTIEIAGIVYSVETARKEVGVDLKTLANLHVVVSKMIEMQKESGIMMQFCFLAIFVIVGIQIMYMVYLAVKRCLKKTVHRAVLEP